MHIDTLYELLCKMNCRKITVKLVGDQGIVKVYYLDFDHRRDYADMFFDRSSQIKILDFECNFKESTMIVWLQSNQNVSFKLDNRPKQNKSDNINKKSNKVNMSKDSWTVSSGVFI